MLAHAREILAKAQATAESIERFKAGESGRVDIGTFQSVSNVLLPRIVRQLRDEHPLVDIRVFEEESAIERLQAGELDLAFWVGQLDGTDSVTLLDDPFVLVARRGEFPEGPVHLKRLDGVQMVAFPPTLCDGGRVDASIAAAGVNPVVVFRTQDNGAVLSMVRAGMGSAIMPRLAVDIKADDPDLCIHEIKPKIQPRKISVMWQAGRTLSPLAQRIIDISVEVADEIHRVVNADQVA
jgi:DNA-binding transcriptional LysR family regulator